jgi:dTDP-4-amino-4,6-dideoxygalactose transaminase
VVHHLFGGAADMPAICAAANGKAIIEVITYSFDAQVQGGPNVGTYGTLATSCLREYTALGAYGDAGMIWTNESDLAERLRQIRREGEHISVYTGITAGNFQMDTIHASILLRKLESRREELARRQELTRDLAAAIAGVGADGIIVPDWYSNTASRFVILIPDRDQMCEHLGRYGIQAEPWWPVPIHLQSGFRKLGYSRGDFPNAEYVADHSMYIPLGSDMTASQRIVEALERFYA